MSPRDKAKLLLILLYKALVNWCKEGWRKPKGEGLIYGTAFIDFYWVTGTYTHHGTCAFILDKLTRPEDYNLWGPFGLAESIHTRHSGTEIFLYRMDWGIAGSEHFADSPKLNQLVRKHPDKKILLVGVRTLDGRLWWVYHKPQNFILIPKEVG